MTSDPEAVTPEFTLNCSSSGGPVSGFSCTTPGGGPVTGTAGLRDPSSTGDNSDRDLAIYILNVTVTQDVLGTYMYTCQATVDRYDGTGVETLTYTAPETITLTSECVNQHISPQ